MVRGDERGTEPLAGEQDQELSLTVSSTDVGCEMVYPAEACIAFEATRDLTFEYRFLHLHMALRSLKESDQTCLRLGEDGLLHLRVRIRAELVEDIFVTYLLSPLMSDEIEEDMSANTAGG